MTSCANHAMKQASTIFVFLMAITFRVLAQDTITGVVSRITAPSFEQNVCDSRFAIVADNATYYVMVDDYWPNPYLEELLIHYDTITVGNEIEVVGTILEMVDENGESFSIFDICQLINASYYYGTGFIDWFSDFAIISCDVPLYNACYISINGELQAEPPIVFNGMTLGNGRYTMIGAIETWPNYDLPILELTHAIPYEIETTAMGIIMVNDELCLTTLNGEKKYLSWSDDDGIHYLTNGDKLHDEDFFNLLWGDSINSTIQGFGRTHFDLFGAPFHTFETLSMETTGERNISGSIISVGNPSTSAFPPIGMTCALINNNNAYLADNPQQWDYSLTHCIIGNDTLPYCFEVSGFFTHSQLFLGNGITPYMKISYDSIKVNTFGSMTINGILAQQSYPNYQYEPFFTIVNEEDEYYIGTGPFTNAMTGCLVVGQNTIYLGDYFSATGKLGRFYGVTATYPSYLFDIHNTIAIQEVSHITGLPDAFITNTYSITNPSNGMIEVSSENPIESIMIYDSLGRMVLYETKCSHNHTLNLRDHKGLALVCIAFQNGFKTIEKVIIR